jgi:hypothetical protein
MCRQIWIYTGLMGYMPHHGIISYWQLLLNYNTEKNLLVEKNHISVHPLPEDI